MAEVAWSPRALRHYQRIVEDVSEHSPARAEVLGEQLLNAPDLLIESPRLGRVVPEYRQPHIRELVFVRPFRITYLYLVEEDMCHVAAIVHGKRDLKRLFSVEDLEDV